MKRNPICKRGHDTRVSGRYRTGGCNVCVAAYRQQEDTKARKNVWQSKYRVTPAGKAAMRRADLRRKYGITPEDYDLMLLLQGKKCGLCRGLNPAKAPRLVVDHDHRTGMARELLCDRCNHLLGNANESEEILQAAIKYVRRWSAKLAI